MEAAVKDSNSYAGYESELKSKESIKQSAKYKAEAAKKKEATKGKTASIVSGLFSMGGIAFKK